MPLYDYACPACGPFSARQPMALYDQPLACPSCQMPAPRVLSVPALPSRAGRSAGESARDPSYARLRHGARCACGAH